MGRAHPIWTYELDERCVDLARERAGLLWVCGSDVYLRTEIGGVGRMKLALHLVALLKAAIFVLAEVTDVLSSKGI